MQPEKTFCLYDIDMSTSSVPMFRLLKKSYISLWTFVKSKTKTMIKLKTREGLLGKQNDSGNQSLD